VQPNAVENTWETKRKSFYTAFCPIFFNA
jgi:hypothetical protein